VNEPTLSAQILGWLVVGAFCSVVLLTAWLGELRTTARRTRNDRETP